VDRDPGCYSAPASRGVGQTLARVTKHVFESASQQVTPDVVIGQLDWQSRSVKQAATHMVPPLLELDGMHPPFAHPPVHEVRYCHCPALLQMSTSEPLHERVPVTHAASADEPEEDPLWTPDELDMKLPDEEDPEPVVASAPEELPPGTVLQSHGPRPVPSCMQIWNPAHPPGPAQASDAPGTHACEPVDASGPLTFVTEAPPHCAASTQSEANASAETTGARKIPTIPSVHPGQRGWSTRSRRPATR
jgi:hypothetical protein